jgi:Carboxypeptidase regulatory-like domain
MEGDFRIGDRAVVPTPVKKPWLLLVLCLALGFAAPVLAQRSTATVRGTVTDQSKGVIPGATVVAKNQDTGLTRSTLTNESGIYAMSDLPVGRYRVDAERSGFKTASRTGILLRVADDYVVDFVLEPGEITEVVTVEAPSVPVKVLGGDVSGVVTGEQGRELPLNGRNFLQLATLMPGVSAPDGLNVKDKGAMSGVDLSVSGSDVTANLWTVDGANNNDVGSNRSILVYPSLEAIEEFKILRNSYGPEFGGAAGAQINVVTRGGTNQFHGSALYSGRNDALDARNYFLEQAGQPKDELSRHDFGASIGGPIVKDKLHVFGSVEWSKEDRGVTRLAFVPTQAERNGDFSGPRITGCSPPIPMDPLTGEPFPGNRIPAGRISPGGQAFLSLYADPNKIPPAGSCNNWVTSLTSPIDWAQYNVRADWTLSSASRLMVRYTQDNWRNDAPNAVFGDDPFPAVDSSWHQPSHSFVASLTQTIGTSATNTLQFSYSGNKFDITRGGEKPGLNSDITSLIAPIYGLDNKQYGDQTPHPLWFGGAGYPPLETLAPWRNNMDLLIVKDDYTQVFGKHLVKAGILVSVNRKNEDTSFGSFSNSFFWGSAGFNGWGATTGNIIAEFLLRDMTWGFQELSAGRSSPERWRDLELYAADSWQVSTRLSVDYGIRYSMFFNPYTADDRIMSFQPDLFDPSLGADPCNGLLQPPDQNWCRAAGFLGGTAGPNRSLMTQDVSNLAPRVGLAYNVFGDGRTVIRGGFGQFFQRERLTPLIGLANNPPFVSTIAGYESSTRRPSPVAGASARASAPRRQAAN